VNILLVPLATIKSHLSTANVEDGHNILQEHVPQDIWTLTACRNPYRAVSGEYIDHFRIDQVHWIYVQSEAVDDNSNSRRNAPAGGKIGSVLEQVDSRRIELLGNLFCQCYNQNSVSTVLYIVKANDLRGGRYIKVVPVSTMYGYFAMFVVVPNSKPSTTMV
jgi:hypothetical protein